MDIRNFSFIEPARGRGFIMVNDFSQNLNYLGSNANWRRLASGTVEARAEREELVKRVAGFIRENRYGGPRGITDRGTLMSDSDRQNAPVLAIVMGNDGARTQAVAVSDAGVITVTRAAWDLKV